MNNETKRTNGPAAGIAPQLELSFSRGAAFQAGHRRRGGRRRQIPTAREWFQRMRLIVDRACDWAPAAPARPEQTWFAGSHRQVAAVAGGGERQICE